MYYWNFKISVCDNSKFDYCGNVIYRDSVLERILNNYSYMDSTGNYHYYIKDYQGNVRAVIDHFGTLEEVNNYYPYGALMGVGTVGNPGVQPYENGTKELDRQNGLDWYDSQARMYDPLLGRTPTMDPNAEDYAPISPYAWCAGNSIRIVDVDGVALRLLDNYKDGAMYVAQIAATSYGGMIIDKLIGNQFTTTHPCRLVAHRRRLRLPCPAADPGQV